MIDYQGPLETDLPGVSVDGSVSRQWAQGTALLSQLKASNQLGATVIVGLGTLGYELALEAALRAHPIR